MKSKIIIIVRKISKLFTKLFYQTKLGRLVIDTIASEAMERVVKVQHLKDLFIFTAPNYLNNWRLKTFSLKEPETLEWIDGIKKGAILWDIGANVGLYSVYAAKKRNCNVYSFEPSVFNLELLARNAHCNKVSDKITILPFPLTSSIGISKLNMTSTSWGGAISTFGEEAIGHDGNLMNKIFEFKTIGLTMDSVVELIKIPQPDHIKMDVDGIEHLILSGGSHILKSVQSILIEINDDFTEQRVSASKILQESGLQQTAKLHSGLVDGMVEFGRTYNQIWERR